MQHDTQTRHTDTTPEQDAALAAWAEEALEEAGGAAEEAHEALGVGPDDETAPARLWAVVAAVCGL